MRFLFPSSVPNLKLESGQLEEPVVIPFDIPVHKRKELLDLILCGFMENKPILVELEWDSIDRCLIEYQHPENIDGIKLTRNTIIITSIDNEKDLDRYFGKYKRLPVLLVIPILTAPNVKTYRKWISQLKVLVVESVQKTIFDDKLLDPALFEDFPFNFVLSHFEDPVDCIYFLNDAINKRMECNDINLVIKTTFCEMMADQFNILNRDELKLLLSLIVTRIIEEISDITSFDKDKIIEISRSISAKGFVHLYGESINPTAPVKKLSDPDFFEHIGILLRKSKGNDFNSLEEMYSRILINLRPPVEAISFDNKSLPGDVSKYDLIYPDFHSDIPDIKDLIKAGLIKSGLNEVAAELDHNKNLINKVSTNLWKEKDEHKRNVLLAARSFAYLIDDDPDKSLTDAYLIKNDRENINIVQELFLVNSGLLISRGKWDMALDILKKMEISQSNNELKGKILGAMGRALFDKGEYEEAFDKYNTALHIFTGLDDRSRIVKTINGMGGIYFARKEYEKALETFKRTLALYTELNDKNGYAQTLNSMGSIYLVMGDNKKASETYSQALELLTKLNDRMGIASALHNIAHIHQINGDYENAMEKYGEALEIQRTSGDRNSISGTLHNMGKIHQIKGSYQQALDIYKQALDIRTELNDRSGIASLLNDIASVHYARGEFESALDAINRSGSIGMKFAFIPSGEFMMGSEENDEEKPVHKVTISRPFYLGIYPVTQKEWKAVMGDNPSYFKGDNLPVENVSWNDAQEFIIKLNQMEKMDKYRLPSEAEWEYAARAGTTTRFSFGDHESELGEYAWHGTNSENKTHDVGQKKPNPLGLYDMHGNVWEWVQDKWHGSYDGAPADGSAWEGGDGSYRVIRGGSWNNNPRGHRSAIRHHDVSDDRSPNLGFRLLRIL